MKAVRSNKGGTMSLEEALNVLLLGYVKGGSGGSGESYDFPNTAKCKLREKNSQCKIDFTKKLKKCKM